MLPKIEIKVSWVHNLMFDENRYLPKEERKKEKYTYEDSLELQKKCSPFIEKFRLKEKEILETIEDKTGHNWNQEKIIVYLSDTVPNSYAEPLTLKFHDAPEAMVFVLIHELIHRNIPSDLQNKLSDSEREKMVEGFTEEVCKELGLWYSPNRNLNKEK